MLACREQVMTAMITPEEVSFYPILWSSGSAAAQDKTSRSALLHVVSLISVITQ